ncbi:MAG: ATP-grasp domain-containing protein [Clostridia bacterium]|nr:ATP-grasp domain-containing protein [Clostridia bacterium]
MIGIMITGCSMHSNDLINVLRDNYDNEEIKIVGINCEDTALLRKGVDAGYVVPRITEPDYISTVIDICKIEGVDVIFPFITAELPIMAANKEHIERHGIKVSVASEAALRDVGDKVTLSKRYPSLMPRQALARTAKDCFEFAASVGYPNKPICCKLPDRCGGLGFSVVDEEKGLDMTLFNKFGRNRYINFSMLTQLVEHAGSEVILQEFEEGSDYSMCGLAENGKLLFGLGFEASLMAFGSAMFANIKQNDEAYRIAEQIVSDSGLDGNFCCDFILKEDGSVKLLEVNPRLSATLPFIAKAGLNLPYLRAIQLLGRDVSKMEFDINYALRMSKNYESEYFV